MRILLILVAAGLPCAVAANNVLEAAFSLTANQDAIVSRNGWTSVAASLKDLKARLEPKLASEIESAALKTGTLEALAALRHLYTIEDDLRLKRLSAQGLKAGEPSFVIAA